MHELNVPYLLKFRNQHQFYLFINNKFHSTCVEDEIARKRGH